mmetsp:Transcript_29183/g.62524  ORF Transcript_29183/g.62524 Transcript_29183/m.62524 type:complete len:412 (+) Transcript_29183:169-1404(+)|eukprot:CAMPEP_0201118004 /NCGR_PEP_ID=MMETSP0850-20130426/2090_1 /ASSEMBLY_ACC=CAM_ASM_000622 /TAXON_ID=183588 /ORGANISM="Pseudo-nitzschia fraudulenta, Strain WWA7" /LENGTH=411 /DNA_ID=CAMNT_0047382861 /DNA_START=122 /DNA_END=1357 /DNA_ORIENTATION=+
MYFGGGDPFAQHFAQGGGGRRPGGRGRPSANVDTTKLYETLGIEKDADVKAIKKAYRKMAMKHHPDKGGDEHTFKEINAAYEVLSDPDKRAKYDKFGLEGIDDEGGGGGGGGEDLFSMFFGGGRGRSGPRRGEDTTYAQKTSLKDLYNGKTVKLAINRQVIVGTPKMCDNCDGQGIILELRQVGMGMVQQVQRRCPNCNGEGYLYNKKKQRKVLEVLIEKGMKHKQKIVFNGMGEEKPNVETGNLNIVIDEQEHPVFKRKGADLLVKKTVSLNEALCGFEWKIEHLDGRDLIVRSQPGEIIRPEAIKIIPNEGMPSYGNPFVKGNLYVVFDVEFPADGSLNESKVAVIKGLLPKPMETATADVDMDAETTEVVHLEHGDGQNFGKGGAASSSSAYDSDEEGDPQAVQCKQS